MDMRRTVENGQQLGALYAELGNVRQPFTITVRQGKGRSLDANGLCWMWASEISRHFGDRTKDEVHGYNKLHFGVPIRRETDEDFREVYDERIKPLPYEAKLALMCPPIDLPVTRDMKSKEMTRFMDEVRNYWSLQGVRLTDPEMQGRKEMIR